jgi:hypothetical protein
VNEGMYEMVDIDKFNIKNFKFIKNVDFTPKDIVNCKVLCFGGNFVGLGVNLTGDEEIL